MLRTTIETIELVCVCACVCFFSRFFQYQTLINRFIDKMKRNQCIIARCVQFRCLPAYCSACFFSLRLFTSFEIFRYRVDVAKSWYKYQKNGNILHHYNSNVYTKQKNRNSKPISKRFLFVNLKKSQCFVVCDLKILCSVSSYPNTQCHD